MARHHEPPGHLQPPFELLFSRRLSLLLGDDISILELASLIKGIVGFDGDIVFDSSKPDGTPRKLVDVTKLNGLGWRANIGLEAGIRATYEWFKAQDDAGLRL